MINDEHDEPQIEPEVVALLARLYSPTTEELLTASRRFDELAKVARQRIDDLANVHQHELTRRERAMLDRASAREFRWAIVVADANLERLHLELVDVIREREFEVRWRREEWTPRSGSHGKRFTSEWEAEDFIAELLEGGPLRYLRVTGRPVGDWVEMTEYATAMLDEPASLRDRLKASTQQGRAADGERQRAQPGGSGYRDVGEG